MAKRKQKKPKFDEKQFKKNLEKSKKEAEKYNLDLRSRVKTKKELLVIVPCTIDSIVGYHKSITHTPQSEMRYGGSSPAYRTGDITYTEIKVKSKTTIETLIFNGWPPLQKGDKIRAYIFKGKKEYEKNELGMPYIPDTHFGTVPYCNVTPPKHLVERDFEKEEKAQTIEKLLRGKVVATYHN